MWLSLSVHHCILWSGTGIVGLGHARAWLSQVTGITDSENVQIAHMISLIHRASLTLQTALDFNALTACYSEMHVIQLVQDIQIYDLI